MISESTRTFAAVIFTDIVGYTALMHSDENLGRQKVQRHRQVIEEEHQRFEGQVINYFGDGT